MLLTIILICLVISLVNALFGRHDTQPLAEHFQWDPLWEGPDSVDCYAQSTDTCLNYSGCGLCKNNTCLQCVPGDINGPFFKEGCNQWIYTNYYDDNVFGEKVTSITPSWDRIQPDYQQPTPDPKVSFTL